MTTGLRGLERLPKESGSHKIVGRDSWLVFKNIVSLVKYLTSPGAFLISRNITPLFLHVSSLYQTLEQTYLSAELTNLFPCSPK